MKPWPDGQKYPVYAVTKELIGTIHNYLTFHENMDKRFFYQIYDELIGILNAVIEKDKKIIKLHLLQAHILIDVVHSLFLVSTEHKEKWEILLKEIDSLIL